MGCIGDSSLLSSGKISYLPNYNTNWVVRLRIINFGISKVLVITKTIVILNEIDKDSILSEYEKQRKATENTEKKSNRLSVIGNRFPTPHPEEILPQRAQSSQSFSYFPFSVVSAVSALNSF